MRDLLLGREPIDFDIAVDVPPERVAALLPDAATEDQAFGACRIDNLPYSVVITSLRTESGYQDHRHPTSVTFVGDPAIDALRRDFTVNAIYADGESGVLFDPCGGANDLERRRIATIGDPDRRFAEDALRLLRALRFAASHDLEPDPALLAAAAAHAPDLRHLSPERVYGELTRTFTGPRRGAALLRFVALGFAAELLPEVAAMDGVPQPPEYHPEGCVLTHVALVLDNVPDGDPVLSWSAILHDIGKPPTFRRGPDRIRFDGHDVLSATMAEAVLARLHASKQLRAAVVEICRDHIRMASLPGMRPRRREQWLRSPLFRQHLAFHRADCMGSHGDLRIHDQALAWLEALPPVREPLVTGTDVLALGVPAGPEVGRLLRAVEAELDGIGDSEPDRGTALQILQRLVAASRQDDRNGSR